MLPHAVGGLSAALASPFEAEAASSAPSSLSSFSSLAASASPLPPISPPFFSPSQDSSPRSSRPFPSDAELSTAPSRLPAFPPTARASRRGRWRGVEEVEQEADAAASLSSSQSASSSPAASPTPQPRSSEPISPLSTDPPASEPSPSPSSQPSSPPSPSSRQPQPLLPSQLRALDAAYPGCVEVDLSHNQLHALCPLHLFARLQLLDLSHNRLMATCLPHLAALTQLCSLSLAYNLIDGLHLLPPLPSLTSLDAACNLIANTHLPHRLHQPLARCCPRLQRLLLQGNPCCLAQPRDAARLWSALQPLAELRWLDGRSLPALGSRDSSSQQQQQQQQQQPHSEEKQTQPEWREGEGGSEAGRREEDERGDRREEEKKDWAGEDAEGQDGAGAASAVHADAQAPPAEWRTPREARSAWMATARGPHGTEKRSSSTAKRTRHVHEHADDERDGKYPPQGPEEYVSHHDDDDDDEGDGRLPAQPRPFSSRPFIPASTSGVPPTFSRSEREPARLSESSPARPSSRSRPAPHAASEPLQPLPLPASRAVELSASIAPSYDGEEAESARLSLTEMAPSPSSRVASSATVSGLRREVSALHALLGLQEEALSEAVSVDARGLAVWRLAMQRLLMRQAEEEQLRDRARTELQKAQGKATRELQQQQRRLEALSGQVQQQRTVTREVEEELNQARVEHGRLQRQLEAAQRSARLHSRRVVEALTAALPAVVTVCASSFQRLECGLAELSARLLFASQRLRMLAALQSRAVAGGRQGDAARRPPLSLHPQAHARAATAVDMAGHSAVLVSSSVVVSELQRLHADRALLLSRAEAAARARADGERLAELQRRSEQLQAQQQEEKEHRERLQEEAQQLRAALRHQSAEHAEQLERCRAEAEAAAERGSAESRRLREEVAALQREAVQLNAQLRAAQKELSRAQAQLQDGDEQRWRLHEEQLSSLQRRLDRSEREREELRMRWRHTLPHAVARPAPHSHQLAGLAIAPPQPSPLLADAAREGAAAGARRPVGHLPSAAVAAAGAAGDGSSDHSTAAPLPTSPASSSSTPPALPLHARLQSLADLSKQLLDVDLDD